MKHDIIFNHDAEKTDIALGISEERSDELVQIVKEAHTDANTTSQCIENILDRVENLAELAWCINMYAILQQKVRTQMEQFESILKDILD